MYPLKPTRLPLARALVCFFSQASAAAAGSASEDACSKMPPWQLPAPMTSTLDFWKKFYPLRVFNSLTRTLTPFVPMDGKRVLW